METADAVTEEKLLTEAVRIAAEKVAKIAAGKILFLWKKAAKVATQKQAVDFKNVAGGVQYKRPLQLQITWGILEGAPQP